MKWHIQFSRYAIVGIANNAIGYFLYLALTYLGVEFRVAMTSLYIVGVLQSFYFNRNWSFRHDGRVSASFLRYVAAYVIGYVVQLGLLTYGTSYLNFPHQAVQGVAIVFVAALLFILQRYWVFSTKRRESTV